MFRKIKGSNYCQPKATWVQLKKISQFFLRKYLAPISQELITKSLPKFPHNPPMRL